MLNKVVNEKGILWNDDSYRPFSLNVTLPHLSPKAVHLEARFYCKFKGSLTNLLK